MKIVKKIIKHPLFAGSMIMIIGNNLVNLLSFIYTLLMGRLLGPANYGTLVSLLSLVGLIAMIPFSLGLVIIKFVSSSKSQKYSEVLINWFNKKILRFSLLITGLVIVTSPITASFLNINNSLLIILIGFSFLFNVTAFYNRSVLQGLLKFKQVVGSVIAENLIKLIFSLIVIYLGWSLFGVVSVYVASSFFSWIITRKFIKDHLSKIDERPEKLKTIFLYAFPVLIQAVSSTSLISADLILVKHFFSSFDAGLYASLSTLGKIVFFAASPVSAVMFPIISKKQSIGENYQRIFFFSLFLTSIISCCVLFVYLFLPSLPILILFGSAYLSGAGLLFWMGVFTAIYTLSSVFISFHLSLGQTKVVIFPAIAAIGQIVGINLFHQSLVQVIEVSITVVSLLLLSLIVYFFYARKTNFSDSSSLQAGKNNR